MAELFGSGVRRYEPPEGIKKHNEKIRRESKVADQKNLPFTLSRPPKRKCHDTFKCTGCDHLMFLPRNSVMVVCSECNKLKKVELYE